MALAAALLVGGCAPHAFHQEWRSGRFEVAAETFRSDSTLKSDPRALYRMALLQLSSESRLYDPAVARSHLRSALRLDPEPALMREARFLLELADRLGELQDRIGALEGRLGELQGEVVELRDRLGELQVRREELQEQREELQVLLERLREQLRALKAIDLGRPPADTTSLR